MSVESFFFVRDAKLPTISQWQAALDQAEVGIVLEDAGDLASILVICPQLIGAIRRGSNGITGL